MIDVGFCEAVGLVAPDDPTPPMIVFVFGCFYLLWAGEVGAPEGAGVFLDSFLQHSNGGSVHSCLLILLWTFPVVSFYFRFAASC